MDDCKSYDIDDDMLTFIKIKPQDSGFHFKKLQKINQYIFKN